MAERNNADALNELVNSPNNGIKAQMKALIDGILSFAPDELNTVAKLVTFVNNNRDNITTIQSALSNKLNINANAVSATKLQNARTLQTNLASTSATSFDGTANGLVGAATFFLVDVIF